MNGELKLHDFIASRETREEDDAPNGRPSALTRKGETSVMVVLLYKINDIYYLDAAATKRYDAKNSVATFLRTVRLSRLSVVGSNNPRRTIASALEKYNKQHGIDKQFKNWEKDPLLRSCVPLVLDENGLLNLGKVTVELSDELGVVYHVNK